MIVILAKLLSWKDLDISLEAKKRLVAREAFDYYDADEIDYMIDNNEYTKEEFEKDYIEIIELYEERALKFIADEKDRLKEKERPDIVVSKIARYIPWYLSREDSFTTRHRIFQDEIIILYHYYLLKEKNILDGRSGKIRNFNSFRDLQDFVESKRYYLNDEDKFYKNKEAELLYKNSNIKFIKIFSQDAACFFGSLEWCISKKHWILEWYKNERKHKYFLLDNYTNNKYAIIIDDHVATVSIWDKDNEISTYNEMIKDFKEFGDEILLSFLIKHPIFLMRVKHINKNIMKKFIDMSDYDDIITYLKSYQREYKYFDRFPDMEEWLYNNHFNLYEKITS